LINFKNVIWEEKYAPEGAIKEELERQIQAYQRTIEQKEENKE